MSNNQEPTIPSMEEAYKKLNLVPNPDGSYTRLNQAPSVPATSDSSNSTLLALSKDIPLNPATGTSIRLFHPRDVTRNTKLPLIIYFHGGGFVLLSAKSIMFHDSCNRMAAKIPAVIASVEYRLAPEHRLPAAYDDAMDALAWVKNQARGVSDVEPWMHEFVDFSRVFLMGSSAGGNIVYHAALRSFEVDLDPVKIVGLIINQPFYGGVSRTESEIKFVNDPIVALHVSDLLWQLALPEGADRGHEYCDPMASGIDVEKIARLPTSVVRGYAGDPLVDKQKEFAGMLEARGVRVVKQFIDKGHHAVEIFDPAFAEMLYNDVSDFVRSINGSSNL